MDLTYAELEQALKTVPPTMVPALCRILLERAQKEVFINNGFDRWLDRVKSEIK